MRPFFFLCYTMIMNFNIYDDRVRKLKNKLDQAMPEEGRRVFRVLRSLEREALALGDPALIGFTYLSYANAHYYRDRFEPIRPYLNRAIKYLLRSSENDQLARAYNLFAVDAQRIGAFDIAYHYFQMAASFVAENEDSVAYALIEGNLGDLMAEMGQFKDAIPHIRKSLKVMNRKKDTFLSRQNSILIQTNLALYRMYAGDQAGAAKQINHIAEEIKLIRETDSRAHLWFLILRLHAALRIEEFEEDVHALTHEVITRIVRTGDYVLFSKDIHRLIRTLIDCGYKREAGTLIRAVEDVDVRDAREESYYARLLHEQIKIRYYKMTSNKKALTGCYERRHEIAALQREEMRKAYCDSVELAQLVEELRREQEAVQRENEELAHAANTDELTGLPNRYALNGTMEETYARCREKNVTFGIGIVDIDQFKFYNDTYGHREGDACLRTVADVLKEIAEDAGLFVARYGGDEFVILYEAMTAEEIGRVEERILNESTVPVTHGMFNAIPDEELRLWDFFARADAQMYRRKRAGGFV